MAYSTKGVKESSMLFIALNSHNMSLDRKQVQPSVEIEVNIKSRHKK